MAKKKREWRSTKPEKVRPAKPDWRKKFVRGLKRRHRREAWRDDVLNALIGGKYWFVSKDGYSHCSECGNRPALTNESVCFDCKK